MTVRRLIVIPVAVGWLFSQLAGLHAHMPVGHHEHDDAGALHAGATPDHHHGHHPHGERDVDVEQAGPAKPPQTRITQPTAPAMLSSPSLQVTRLTEVSAPIVRGGHDPPLRPPRIRHLLPPSHAPPTPA
jgi:hypothetical protein